MSIKSLDPVEQSLQQLLAMSEGGNAVIPWEQLTTLQRRALQSINAVGQNQIPFGDKVYGVRNEIVARIFSNGGVFVTVYPNSDAIPETQDIY